MAKSSRGTNQDRKKIAGGQDYEVNYETEKLNTTGDKIKQSIKKVGNSRKKVEDDVKKKG